MCLAPQVLSQSPTVPTTVVTTPTTDNVPTTPTTVVATTPSTAAPTTTTTAVPTTTTIFSTNAPAGTSYVGCFADDVNNVRDFPYWYQSINPTILKPTWSGTGVDDKMTIELCQQGALNFGMPYFALQDGNQCFLSDSPPSFAQLPDTSCTFTCHGTTSAPGVREYCGGNSANQVYRVDSLIKPPNGYTDVTSEFFQYKGCLEGMNVYGDRPVGKIFNLNGGVFVAYNGKGADPTVVTYPYMNVELCAYVASLSGYEYFGLSYGSFCHAATPSSFYNVNRNGTCNAACGDSATTEICGGNAGSVSYYQINYAPPQPASYAQLQQNITLPTTTTTTPTPIYNGPTVPFEPQPFGGTYFTASTANAVDKTTYECAYVAPDFSRLVYITVTFDTSAPLTYPRGVVAKYGLTVQHPNLNDGLVSATQQSITTLTASKIPWTDVIPATISYTFISPQFPDTTHYLLGGATPLISKPGLDCGEEINQFLTNLDKNTVLPLPLPAGVQQITATTLPTTAVTSTVTTQPTAAPATQAPAQSQAVASSITDELSSHGGSITALWVLVALLIAVVLGLLVVFRRANVIQTGNSASTGRSLQLTTNPVSSIP